MRIVEKQKSKEEVVASSEPASGRFKIYSYSILSFCAVISSIFAIYLYHSTQNLLQDRLQERLTAIVSTARLSISANDVNRLVDLGSRSLGTAEYSRTVQTLQAIKRTNADIAYTYIFGNTEDPNQLSYIADADVYALVPELYFNENENVEEGLPGSFYDTSEVPNLRDRIAFEMPIADAEPFEDEEWGTLFSAYAPIEGTDAIIGVDVHIQDFNRLVNSMFVPFALFIILLLTLLTILTISLVKMWGSRVELLRDLDRQKDELLSIVSHQLAQPISALKWYIEMLVDGDVGSLTKEQQEYLQTMNASAANLADLSSMILDVSRFQLGKPKLDRVPVNLHQFFEDILSVIEPKAKEKQMDFKKKVTKNLPKEVMLDKRLTRMTVENLLSNAVKYTPEKGAVSFTVENKDGVMHLAVKDSGVGIPAEDQKKIFGKLFRASNTNGIDGNGFGLYVAKNAIEAQGGSIRFESTEGKGTTFFVELPLVKPSEEGTKNAG